VVYIDHRNRFRRFIGRKINKFTGRKINNQQNERSTSSPEGRSTTNKTKGEFIMTATPDDWEEMTEKQANEEGVFDCPTCGHLRETCEMTPEEADEWAASRGVKIVRT
jgi:hypothetical protein